jgi:IMP dehydrogenase
MITQPITVRPDESLQSALGVMREHDISGVPVVEGERPVGILTARDIRFDGVAADSNLLPKVRAVESPAGEDSREAWAIRQDEWVARIELLVSAFLAGQAGVDPRPKACEYCHVVSVCRIADEGADAVERNIGE